ncbi:MAG: hypothetical protein E7295_10175 [Lachnospiraceae bacterium]|jgi:hypothetical protein|nr:hypothetical protein [Lachnospiraceae bacterium]
MNWKQTKVSSALWVLLTTITCIAGFYGVFGFCGNLGIQGIMIWVVYAGVLLFGGLFSVFAIRIKNKFFAQVKDRASLWMLLEFLLFVAILTGGNLFRIQYLKNFNVGNMYYVVTMKYGETLPNTYLGAEDLYLQILHGICFLFGNTTYFCIRFHMVLTVFAGIVWYFAVRKLSGRIPALTFSAFYFLSPFIIKNSLFLTAEPLIFLLYGIGLWIAGAYLNSVKSRIIAALIAGIIAGIAGYMDVFGFTLLFVAASVWHLDGTQAREGIKKILVELGTFVGGACVGFFAGILIKALTAGASFGAVVKGWLDLYAPRTFVWPEFLDYLWSCLSGFLASWTGVLLIILLVFAIFGFLMKNKAEKISPWIGVLVVTLLGIYLQMPPAISGIVTTEDGLTMGTLIDVPFDGCLLLLGCLFVLAGIGIDSIFVPVFVKEEKQENTKHSIWESLDPRKLPAWIKKKKAERKEKLAYAMEHPEAMEGKGIVSKFLVERAKKKEQAKQEIDKVMHALNSLSEDHIVWTDGIKPSKNAAPITKEEQGKEESVKIETKVEETKEEAKEETKEEAKKEAKEKAKEKAKEDTKENSTKSDSIKENADKADASEGDMVKANPVQKEKSDEESTKEELIKEELIKEELIKEELIKEELTKEESTKEDSIKEEPVIEKVTQNDDTEAEITKVEENEEKSADQVETKEETKSEEPAEEKSTEEKASEQSNSSELDGVEILDLDQEEMKDVEILDLEQEEVLKKEPKKNYNKTLASVLEFDYEAVDDEDYDIKE